MSFTNAEKRKVLADAARLIRKGTVRFTCSAIEWASYWYGASPYTTNGSWLVNEHRESTLVGEYREFTFAVRGAAPYWWNSGHAFKDARVDALEAFRNSIPEDAL